MDPRDVAADVASDHAHGVGRHVELVALRVLEDEVVALRTAELSVDDALVAPDPVDPMHGEVPGVELVRHAVGACAP